MKTFETVNDLIEDEKFSEFAQAEIDRIKYLRFKSRIPDLAYRRDWYDRLCAIGAANVDFFKKNAMQVLRGESTLSAELRNVVRLVVHEAAAKTIKFYNIEENEPDSNK